MLVNRQLSITPEEARQVLSGEKPLGALLGVSEADVAEMATFGLNLWRQGRYQDAARMFEAIVSLDDSIYYGHAGLGLAAMKLDDLATAEKHLVRALELSPEDASVAANLGETFLRLGRLPEAIEVMQKAASLDPSGRDPGAARARGILLGIGHGAAELTTARAKLVGK